VHQKGFAALVKLPAVTKVNEDTTRQWLIKQVIWHFFPMPHYLPLPEFKALSANKLHQANLFSCLTTNCHTGATFLNMCQQLSMWPATAKKLIPNLLKESCEIKSLPRLLKPFISFTNVDL